MRAWRSSGTIVRGGPAGRAPSVGGGVLAEARSDVFGIAIVGAESTGKTTLAQALAERLRAQTGLRVACVGEWLRQWCDAAGRTPLAHEQASILRAQHERIEAAHEGHDIVVCDTTALMTATYSRLVFGDSSLDARAAELHRRHVTATLVTALDLPWVPDGLQRDGPHVREPVDDTLRSLLRRHEIPFAVVGGSGPARLAQALAALQPWLGAREAATKPAGGRAGLFSGLQARRGGARWACECCVPEAEQALAARRRAALLNLG
jgi:nicotinamide riboside kinase